MKGKDLFEAVGHVGGDLVEEAAEAKRSRPVGRYLALAACACLVLGGGLAIARSGLLGTTASSPAIPGGGSEETDAADGAVSGDSYVGHEEGSVFMSYAGPVFPLTLAEDNGMISAARALTFDFTEGESCISQVGVTDTYTLTNGSDEEQTVTAIYPFADSLLGLEEPALTVDGEAVSTGLRQGMYSGGFQGASLEDLETGSWNLASLDSWEKYKALLASGDYQAQAFADDPVLSEPVILYELSDEEMPAVAGRAATIAMSFTIDASRTTVLTYDINGCSLDTETGWRQYSYFVQEWDNDARPRVIALLGEDIEEYEVTGYSNGSCSDDVLLSGATAKVTRTETTLGALLDRLCTSYVAMADRMYGEGTWCTGQQLTRAAAEMLTQYGQLSSGSAQRYADGRLDDIISDALVVGRVFYLTAEVTIPAGSSVTVSVSYTKDGSFDFDCAGTQNAGVYGYDAVTQLGSNLRFTEQTAAIDPHGRIEIVRQNFGFDLDTGVTKVTLDPAQEHYYLEVRALTS